MDDRFERPHRDTTGYMMRAYSKMLYLRELISKEKANEYYGKCMELARARGDLAEIYSTSARYYQYMGEYERAVAYIDSAVTVYKRNGTKADFASIYAVQSWLYENLGDYKTPSKRCAHPIRSATTTAWKRRRTASPRCRPCSKWGSWSLKNPGWPTA